MTIRAPLHVLPSFSFEATETQSPMVNDEFRRPSIHA
ncbi:hypothetical protein LMG31506_00338 [Cupriavidus yeoncheonensis]|uniref:Uncharacterized protein n=1 Tax=Cupriavidus yeoncheonensis TaxID=1462994 RepID=A0A916IPG8_9BURK|nr:hypothetical protein LMG31506_00338 [Cupriavidus yeoncheonensis]